MDGPNTKYCAHYAAFVINNKPSHWQIGKQSMHFYYWRKYVNEIPQQPPPPLFVQTINARLGFGQPFKAGTFCGYPPNISPILYDVMVICVYYTEIGFCVF